MLKTSPELNAWFDRMATELEISAIRSQGAGGQNVNKVASAIHLRLSIADCSLPEEIKQALLELKDKRITKEGVLVIKAQQYRTQEANRQDAIDRLVALIKAAAHKPKNRLATRPTKSSQRRRLEQKTQRGQIKSLRRNPLKD